MASELVWLKFKNASHLYSFFVILVITYLYYSCSTQHFHTHTHTTLSHTHTHTHTHWIYQHKIYIVLSSWLDYWTKDFQRVSNQISRYWVHLWLTPSTYSTKRNPWSLPVSSSIVYPFQIICTCHFWFCGNAVMSNQLWSSFCIRIWLVHIFVIV